ncbi:MAG: efflux RND transporter periplasmic adaptor subunit [Owenweeksia sp.]
MKTQIIAIVSIAFLVACQPQAEEGSLEAKQQELQEKQEELSQLKAEISALQDEIADLDTNNEERLAKVEVTTIQPQSFDHFVKLTGTVTSKENIMISAETSGRVKSIPTNEGQRVGRGTVLVRIDNDIVSNQLQEAKASFELAETTYQKRKNLWEQNIGSEIEYLQAKNNFETAKSRYAQLQNQYNNTIIKAPINGTVDNISVKEGEYVNMGAPIIRVVDLDRVEIEAELSEEYLPNVKRGDSVKVEIPALGITRKAPVSFVSQVINPDNRSFKIKINLPNKDGLIKPNVLANLMIRDYHSDEALVVPSSCIKKDLKGDFVLVTAEEGGETVVNKKYVTRGKSFGDVTEIKKGLQKDDRVITVGYNQVTAGEKIAIQ